MAFEPSDNAASHADVGSPREGLGPSLPAANSGFSEQGALFRNVLDLPVELRALRDIADPALLRFAAARAEQLGISAHLIAVRSGILSEDLLLEAYAADLGIETDPLDDNTADAHFDALDVLARGILPAGSRKHGRATIAFSGDNLRALYAFAPGHDLRKRFRITSPSRLRAFVERTKGPALAAEAAFGLQESAPVFSAATTRFKHYRATLLAALTLAALCFYFAPGPARFAVELVLAAVFMSWAVLRLYACVLPERRAPRVEIPERELPFYTLLIPLYREAGIAGDLVNAISALNYPREKLDVKLIVEPDDTGTIEALATIKLDPCFEIIRAPLIGPRTKPKALRAALPLVRGEFVVVYDAEDRPHPDQLRDAYACFATGERDLACVQARLAIDNRERTFLTEHFRAEYSGLFDVLLPALARLRLPLPLGGTSNHFRVAALRKTGAWDPHNVTEDADLGVRLARFGYTTGVVDSTTWEEAPDRLAAWRRQRTRWMKGWMQTYLVHMREPLRLLRELGWRGFIAFQLLIGGSVLAALVHPIFVVLLIVDAALGSLFSPAQSLLEWAHKGMIASTLLAGYIGSGALAFVGMRRRMMIAWPWVLPSLPLYWLLLSAAAWRAVWKLITSPYQWEKTAHGVVPRSAMKA